MNVGILGKGYVGNYLHLFLKDKKHINQFFISKNDFNYTDINKLKEFINFYKINIIVNCSGYTGRPNVDGCEDHKDECWLYNVIVSNNINRACNESNIKCVHVSSGCIYTGYEKVFNEEDTPNFGIYSNVSSFYSKTKHAFETLCDLSSSAILRIRMPFNDKKEDKNYLYKLYKYSNLISMKNSLTYIPDLCNVIYSFIENFNCGIYNVVNDPSLNAEQIINVFKNYNFVNNSWKFINVSELNVIANRSNCILSNDKLKKLGIEMTPVLNAVDRSVYYLSKS